jgi:GxxExxY protein
LESTYEECLCYELNQAGLSFQRQVHLPIVYKGLRLDRAYIMDLVVEDTVVVEIKASEDLAALHAAQLLTYLKCSGKRVGLLINFSVPILKNGLKRIVNRYAGPRPRLKTSAPSAVAPLQDASANFQKNSALPPRLRVSASNPQRRPTPNLRPRLRQEPA